MLVLVHCVHLVVVVFFGEEHLGPLMVESVPELGSMFNELDVCRVIVFLVHFYGFY